LLRRALRHANAEVVLIDRRTHHIFQPEGVDGATSPGLNERPVSGGGCGCYWARGAGAPVDKKFHFEIGERESQRETNVRFRG
jgi:hypothetical protein